MRVEFSAIPVREGIFGPEVIVNATSGAGCLRLFDGRTIGRAPDSPWTNVFVVWLGRPIAVVSEGIQPHDAERVAVGLRDLLRDPALPVVFSLGWHGEGTRARAISDRSVQYAKRELARAEAYALVQAALLERDRIEVELDGHSFQFQVQFHCEQDGEFAPRIK